MRTLLTIAAAAPLVACGGHQTATPAASADAPRIRAGLWEQVVTRDGRRGPLARMRVCLDAATGAQVSLFGRHAVDSMCRRTVDRHPDGAWTFTSACPMGDAGLVRSTGVARGDFGARYSVHVLSDVTGSRFGSANGRHVVDVSAAYVGPCPIGVASGDVLLGGGMKVNLRSLGRVADVLGAGA